MVGDGGVARQGSAGTVCWLDEVPEFAPTVWEHLDYYLSCQGYESRRVFWRDVKAEGFQTTISAIKLPELWSEDCNGYGMKTPRGTFTWEEYDTEYYPRHVAAFKALRAASETPAPGGDGRTIWEYLDAYVADMIESEAVFYSKLVRHFQHTDEFQRTISTLELPTSRWGHGCFMYVGPEYHERIARLEEIIEVLRRSAQLVPVLESSDHE